MKKKRSDLERVMKWWAKISSLGIIAFLIYGVLFGIYVIIRTSNLIPLGGFSLVSILFLVLVANLIAVIIFGTPLFYFAWVKKPTNNTMKIWAKVSSILLILFLIGGFVSPTGFENIDIPYIFPSLIILVPIFYFAWRK